jgi:signal transduction histidine kinase
VRLTVHYAAAFFFAGAALVALMYLFLGQALDRQLTAQLDHAPQEVHSESGVPPSAFEEALEARRTQLTKDRDDTLNSMLVASLASLGLVGVISVGFGWLLASRALRPLQEITGTAQRVADRSLHERIALDGPSDEIKDLADTFDAMLERLDRAFDSQRRFVANASHELRTPLTINRTLIEVALEDSAANESVRQLGITLLAVNQRHERLIDGLLTLASSEQQLTETNEIDLADVARHVAQESRDTARSAGIDLQVDLGFAQVNGDPVLLERLTQNLLDNAIRYNVPHDGKITVTTAPVGGHACLTVENTGPQVPPYEVAGLFEPFRRLSTSERIADRGNGASRGAGLGLSIVRSVARAHGGDVDASPRAEGGLTVRVLLPLVSGRHAIGGRVHPFATTRVARSSDAGER